MKNGKNLKEDFIKNGRENKEKGRKKKGKNKRIIKLLFLPKQGKFLSVSYRNLGKV